MICNYTDDRLQDSIFHLKLCYNPANPNKHGYPNCSQCFTAVQNCRKHMLIFNKHTFEWHTLPNRHHLVGWLIFGIISAQSNGQQNISHVLPLNFVLILDIRSQFGPLPVQYPAYYRYGTVHNWRKRISICSFKSGKYGTHPWSMGTGL